MDTAERTLVVILSAALAVLLLLAIVAIIKLIQLLTTLKRLADRAEELADAAHSVGDNLKSAVSSLAIGRLFSKAARTVFDKQQTRKRGKRSGRNE